MLVWRQTVWTQIRPPTVWKHTVSQKDTKPLQQMTKSDDFCCD